MYFCTKKIYDTNNCEDQNNYRHDEDITKPLFLFEQFVDLKLPYLNENISDIEVGGTIEVNKHVYKIKDITVNLVSDALSTGNPNYDNNLRIAIIVEE